MKSRRGGWFWVTAAVLLAAACLLPFLVKNYRVFQFNLVLVYAIAILGLNILTGYNGQISLGHGAFYAIGAYAAAILMERVGWPYWATLPVAGVLCFVLGVLMGLPALRLGGHHLAVATLALALAVPQLLKYRLLEPLTGGVQGIVVTKPEPPFSFRLLDQPLSTDRWLYLFTLAVTLVMFVLAWNLLRGRVGRALIAIRDHPIAATAMGINLPRFKTATFGTSAAFTGVAGALSATVVGFVSPDSFTLSLSIILLVGVVVGGLASIGGALLRGDLHPVRPEHRRQPLQVGARGRLRRAADPADVPDAHRRDGPAAQAMARWRKTPGLLPASPGPVPPP